MLLNITKTMEKIFKKKNEQQPIEKRKRATIKFVIEEEEPKCDNINLEIDSFLRYGIGERNSVLIYSEEENAKIEKYLSTLIPIELKAMKIAKEHLKSSFNIVKSNDYVNWRKNEN